MGRSGSRSIGLRARVPGTPGTPGKIGTICMIGAIGVGLSCGRDSTRTLPVDLLRRLESAAAIRLEVDEASLAQAAQGARERLLGLGWPVELPDAARSGEARHRLPRIRVGTFDATWAPAVCAVLGLEVDGKRLHLAGRSYRVDDSLVVATLPDPEQPGAPLTVLLAERSAALASGLERVLPGWRSSAFVWNGGDLRLEVPLDPRGRPRLDAARDVEPPWRGDVHGYRSLADEPTRLHLRFATDVPAERASAIVAELAVLRGRVQEVAPFPGDEPRVTRVVLEATVDRLAGYPVADELAFADVWPGRVVGLAGDGLPDGTASAAAQLWLTESWGPAARAWLAEGLPLERADRYWGRALESWAGRLLAAGLVPPVEVLVAPECERELSLHCRRPARALLARFLLETRGHEELGRLWRGDAELAVSTELEAAFRAFLGERLQQRTERGAPDERELPRMRGAALTQPLEPGVAAGARASTGWGTAACRESLDELRALGANAVWLPCFFAGAPGDGQRSAPGDGRRFAPGDGRPIAFSNRAGALDGDAAVATVAADARARGFAVALGFELLAETSGTWAGDLKYLSPDAWEAFFDGYERAALHYALLAELVGADLLSVGGGMAKASSGVDDGQATRTAGEHEAEARLVRRAAWDHVIATARALFDGLLTYDAGWPQAQRVELWDRLDAVGVTLTQDLTASAPDGSAPVVATGIDPGARRIAGGEIWTAERFAREVDRPLVVTIGFRSTARAASGEVDAGGPADPWLQAELLGEVGATLRNLARSSREPRGVFLWEWASDPGAGGTGDRSHTPQGKPGRARLGEIFE